MSVAFDVGPLKANPAGVGIYVQSLASGLAQIGRQDLTYIGRRVDASGLPESVPSHWRSTRLPYPVWVELLGARAVRLSGGSVAHFTDGLVPFLRPRPTVVTVLDLSLIRHWRSHRVLRFPRIPLLIAAPRLASRVIAISSATADEVIRLTGTPARKIDVIPLAPRASAQPAPAHAIQEVRGRLGLTDTRHLLVPGTIEPRKNHLRVLAAFEQLIRVRSTPDDLLLVLAGQLGWKSTGVMEAIEASPARERIRFLGYVAEHDLAALMTSAEAVVYVSTYEGFGLPVIEAMACGASVVTSNTSSMPEVAGDAAVLVDPFDVQAIARGIATALQANEQARRLALERASQFTWAATASATAAVYDALDR